MLYRFCCDLTWDTSIQPVTATCGAFALTSNAIASGLVIDATVTFKTAVPVVFGSVTVGSSNIGAGLQPVHLHAQSCKNGGGAHFMYDTSVSAAVEGNEVWFKLTTDAVTGAGFGAAFSQGVLDVQSARSIVIHDGNSALPSKPKAFCCDLTWDLHQPPRILSTNPPAIYTSSATPKELWVPSASSAQPLVIEGINLMKDGKVPKFKVNGVLYEPKTVSGDRAVILLAVDAGLDAISTPQLTLSMSLDDGVSYPVTYSVPVVSVILDKVEPKVVSSRGREKVSIRYTSFPTAPSDNVKVCWKRGSDGYCQQVIPATANGGVVIFNSPDTSLDDPSIDDPVAVSVSFDDRYFFPVLASEVITIRKDPLIKITVFSNGPTTGI
jgi:hypothetical protein